MLLKMKGFPLFLIKEWRKTLGNKGMDRLCNQHFLCVRKYLQFPQQGHYRRVTRPLHGGLSCCRLYNWNSTLYEEHFKSSLGQEERRIGVWPFWSCGSQIITHDFHQKERWEENMKMVRITLKEHSTII